MVMYSTSLYSLLSRTVSKLLRIISQICTFDRVGLPLFNALVQGDPLN